MMLSFAYTIVTTLRIAKAGDNIMDSRVYAHVSVMSYHSIVDISCLRVFLTKL